MNCDYFYEVEKKYNLFEKEYNGFEFWVYIRGIVKWKIQKQVDSVADAHYKKDVGRIENYVHLLKQLMYVVKNGKIPNKQYDVLIMSHPRRIFNGNKYECIYTDILAEKFDNSITIEKPYQGIHYTPAESKKIVYTDIVDLEIQFYSIYKSFFHKKQEKKLRNIFKDALKKAIDDLNEYYETDISLNNIVTALIYKYYEYRILYNYFTKILKKIEPRVIIEVVSYSVECQVLNEVAYGRQIPTVELQHGVITKDHIAYNYPKNQKIRTFPQNIFLFADFWKNGIRYPISNNHIVATGYPYLERQKKCYEKNNMKKKRQILFLSSGPIGTILANTAVKLKGLLPERDYEIIYKLHPGEYIGWKERYPFLLENKIKVISDNKTNLYQLFSESDIQISGFNSTTIYEGIYYGLQTYVENYCLIDEIRNLEELNLLHVYKSVEELAELIQTNKVSERKATTLWKENALENVMFELERIMEK